MLDLRDALPLPDNPKWGNDDKKNAHLGHHCVYSSDGEKRYGGF